MELPPQLADACEEKCKDIEHAESVLSDPYAPMHKWPIDLRDNAFKFLDEQDLDRFELPDADVYPKLRRYMLHARAQAEKKMTMLRKEAAEQEARREYEQSREFKLEKARQAHEDAKKRFKWQSEQLSLLERSLAQAWVRCDQLDRECKEAERAYFALV